jgi:hypothetical protein
MTASCGWPACRVIATATLAAFANAAAGFTGADIGGPSELLARFLLDRGPITEAAADVPPRWEKVA